jgi:hypothetical protein
VRVDRSITAEVKTVLGFGISTQSGPALEDFVPQDPEHFGVTVQVLIGRTTSDLVDSFDLIVCSEAQMRQPRFR